MSMSLPHVLATHKPKFLVVMNDVGQSTIQEMMGAVLRPLGQIKLNLKDWSKSSLEQMILGMEHPSLLSKTLRSWKLAKEKQFPAVFVLEAFGLSKESLQPLMDWKANIHGCVIDDVTDEAAALHLIASIPEDGFVALNADKKVGAIKKMVKQKVVTYGMNATANFQGMDMKVSQSIVEGELHLRGMTCKIKYEGNTVPLFITGVLGEEAIYSALASLAVGHVFGLSVVDMLQAMQQVRPSGGRLRILPGIKHTTIIDDTFAMDMESFGSGMQVLGEIEVPSGKKKIVVVPLASTVTSAESKMMAKQISDAQATHVVFLHDKDTKKPDMVSLENKMVCTYFTDVSEAGLFVQGLMKKGDLVYIEGDAKHQSERIVKEIMADPAHANALLARTHEEWKM